ncbi:MAG: hypothetical protein LAT82_03290 [Nanoarchaeota archaeon]|nr:hypothetical protein [Nanoarchaeota archaeon]
MENRKIREPIREKNRVNYDPNSNSKKESSSKKKSKASRPQEDVVANRVDTMNTSSTSSELGKIWLLWVLKIVLVVLAVLFILLLIILAVNFIGNDRGDSSTNGITGNESNQDINNTIVNNVSDSTQLELFTNNSQVFEIISIENANCEFCQINETRADLEEVLLSIGLEEQFEFRGVEYSSDLANQIKEVLFQNGLNFDFTPLFLLPTSIENLELFQEEEFRSLFIQVQGGDFYVLNPQITPIKYLNSDVQIPQDSITFGNLQGVPITFIYDYNCVRCQVMNGDENEVNNFINLELIDQNYTAPIPQLLVALLGVENPFEDVTFNLRFVPAPVSENSEIAHRAIYCSNQQGLFVPMHIELVDIHNGSTMLTSQNVSSIAQEILELDVQEFEECMVSQEATSYVEGTYQFLRNYGVTSLPLTIVGNYPIPELIDYNVMSIFMESEFRAFDVELEG